MLFRNKDGILVELNRLNYVNDIEYYRAISNVNGIKFISKQHNTLDTMLSLSKKGFRDNNYQNNNANRKNVTKNHYISYT